MTKTWANENLEVVISLFDLKEELEINDTVSKLNYIEANWLGDNGEMKDLIDAWNTITNESMTTMNQSLNSLYTLSVAVKGTSYLSTKDVNLLTKLIATNMREDGKIIGNTLNTILKRIETDVVINELNERKINVTSNDGMVTVFQKIKSYLTNIADESERKNEVTSIAKLLGGTYNISRVNTIINSI